MSEAVPLDGKPRVFDRSFPLSYHIAKRAAVVGTAVAVLLLGLVWLGSNFMPGALSWPRSCYPAEKPLIQTVKTVSHVHTVPAPGDTTPAASNWLSGSQLGSPPSSDRSAIRELSLRGGWLNFLRKVRQGKFIATVAFIGGSVTERDCWRPQVMDLFRRRYPSVKFKEVNAGIGGTGSDLGAFRMDRDVILHEPDLVFIEFAQNDMGLANEDANKIIKTAEGMVRKLRRSLPSCDIAFVYITSEQLARWYDLERGIMPKVVQMYERVAKHYDITSVHLGLEIIRKATTDQVMWQGNATDDLAASGGKYIFGDDGLHPYYHTGCTAYAQAISRSLPELEQSSKGVGAGLPTPLHPNNYENARLVNPDCASMSSSVQKNGPGVAKDKPYSHVGGFLAQKPGATFRFPFYGVVVGVFMFVGPFSGDLIVSIDDEPPRPFRIFQTFCHYPRRGFYVLFDNLDQSNHTLVVDVSPVVPPKQSILAKMQQTIDPAYINETTAVFLGFGVS